MNKKICMKIDNSFVSDARVEKEIKSLIKAKYEIIVLAHSEKGLPQIENRNGYKVKRVIKNNPIPMYNIIKDLIAEKADYYHAHNVDSLLPCYIATLVNRSKFIYDTHEYWKGFTNANNNKKRKILIYLQRYLIQRVDLLISVNMEIIKKIKKDNNYTGKAVAILNAPHYRKLKEQSTILPRTEKSIIHIGAIQVGRGLLGALDAMKYLSNDYSLYFLGPDNYPGGFTKEIKKRKLQNRVFLLGKVDHNIVTKEASFADVSLVLTENLSENYYLSLPNKLFESMIAGLPVVASKMEVIKKIVKKADIGVLCDVDNPSSIANAIEKAYLSKNKFSKNSSKAATIYNWENEGDKLIKYYNEL